MDKWCSKQDHEKAADSDALEKGKCHCCGEDISNNHDVSVHVLYTGVSDDVLRNYNCNY